MNELHPSYETIWLCNWNQLVPLKEEITGASGYDVVATETCPWRHVLRERDLRGRKKHAEGRSRVGGLYSI